MLSYQQWDQIADAYTPLLFFLALIALALSTRKYGWRHALQEGLFLLSSLVFVYTLMFADQAWQFWPRFGLDYSTHTAVSLVLVSYLILAYRRMAWAIAASLVLYFMLMLYQQYHSFADIATTVLAVLPVLLLLHRFVFPVAANVRPHPENIM